MRASAEGNSGLCCAREPARFCVCVAYRRGKRGVAVSCFPTFEPGLRIRRTAASGYTDRPAIVSWSLKLSLRRDETKSGPRNARRDSAGIPSRFRRRASPAPHAPLRGRPSSWPAIRRKPRKPQGPRDTRNTQKHSHPKHTCHPSDPWLNGAGPSALPRGIPAEGDSAFSGANSPGYIDRHPIAHRPLVPWSFSPSSLSPYPPRRKLALTWNTALTIAKAMKPTKTKTPISTPLAMTLVKRFNCAEICRW